MAVFHVAHRQLGLVIASILGLLMLNSYVFRRRAFSDAFSPSLSRLPDVDHPGPLAALGLSDEFEYTRRCIVPTLTPDIRRAPRQDVPWSLDLTSSARFHINGLDSLVLPDCDNVFTVNVPGPTAKPRCSPRALTVGVATTHDRLATSLDEMARWLAYTDVELIAYVLPTDNTPLSVIQDLQRQADSLGINAQVIQAPFGDAARSNFALAAAFRDRARPLTQWFAIIDDDTFFPNLDELLEQLHHFDPSEEHYIGAYTESHQSRAEHGLLAQGGAGIFISAALMHHLGERYEECDGLIEGWREHWWGDHIWRDAIRAVTSPPVLLTPLTGLHQADFGGDVSGFYESGLSPLLSLHHWKSWHSHNHPAAHLVADVAGPSSYLQRYVTADSAVLVNGYSIATYRDLPDLGLMEQTFDTITPPKPEDADIQFRDTFGTLRPRLSNADKRSWKWQLSIKAARGRHTQCVRQFYVRHSSGPGEADSVIELDWCEA